MQKIRSLPGVTQLHVINKIHPIRATSNRHHLTTKMYTIRLLCLVLVLTEMSYSMVENRDGKVTFSGADVIAIKNSLSFEGDREDLEG